MSPTTRSQAADSSPTTGHASALESSGLRQRPREGSRSRNIEDVYDAKYAVDLATTTVDENVFLFVPNLIGYARVILAGFSLYYMPWHPKVCTALYGISCLLDAVDGQAARALDQTSKFGAVLDMVTDRCTTACLLCFLGYAYPKLALLFQFLISLDFASHYIHMYSSLVTGSSSHKNIQANVSRILWYYYNDSRTLFIFCFANELFFVCMYLNAFKDNDWCQTRVWSGIAKLIMSSPLALQFPDAAAWVATHLASVTWPQLIGALCFPICAGKQIINIVQFWKASKILVGIDLQQREEQRRAKKIAEIKEKSAIA